jgi:hypothetical protein
MYVTLGGEEIIEDGTEGRHSDETEEGHAFLDNTLGFVQGRVSAKLLILSNNVLMMSVSVSDCISF